MAAKVYSLIVKCEKKDKRKYGLRLYFLGLRWDSDAFYGCVQYKAYRKIWAFCEKHGIPVKIDKSYAVRSSSYRKMFFEKHKPQLGKYYVCAYCGKLLLPENVTVDHLYPIKKARESREIQRKLRKMGIMDINDPRNLVPACAKCNGHKAAKTGLWIFRGQIGRSVPLWIVRKILRICLFVLLYRIRKVLSSKSVSTNLWNRFLQLLTVFYSKKRTSRISPQGPFAVKEKMIYLQFG